MLVAGRGRCFLQELALNRRWVQEPGHYLYRAGVGLPRVDTNSSTRSRSRSRSLLHNTPLLAAVQSFPKCPGPRLLQCGRHLPRLNISARYFATSPARRTYVLATAFQPPTTVPERTLSCSDVSISGASAYSTWAVAVTAVPAGFIACPVFTSFHMPDAAENRRCRCRRAPGAPPGPPSSALLAPLPWRMLLRVWGWRGHREERRGEGVFCVVNFLSGAEQKHRNKDIGVAGLDSNTPYTRQPERYA